MDPFNALRAVVTEQNLLGEFPDWLLPEVLEIADSPDKYGFAVSLVRSLTEQIRSYDPFAGSGCFNSSVSADTIQLTIGRIKSGS